VTIVKYFIPILLVLCIISSPAASQWITTPDFNTHAQRGINDVYNFEFEKADSEFSYLAITYPSHPAGKFFLAMIDWWNILMNVDDESKDDEFVRKLDLVIDLCDSLLDINENDVSALFFKGGALGFRGRLRANRESWIKAANDGRLALPIVQHAYKIAPDNDDILLGIGIYNYYAYIIPQKYPIVKPLMIFFPSGDKNKGIQQLTEASKHAQFASIEAKYFLLQLYYSYEKQYDSSYAIAVSLFQRFPNNVIFHRYLGRSAFVLGKYEDAYKIFTGIWLRCEQGKRGYGKNVKREAMYYLGTCEMNKKSYDSAKTFFLICDGLCRELDTSEQSGFMAMANLKLGMIYDIQNRRSDAEKQYRKVLTLEKYENSYELAKTYLKKPYVP
jgi:tetratricopeptide (TPR) repeat protein